MNLSNTIRFLSYIVAVLTLGYAVYETREYFIRDSNVSRWVALIKIAAPLIAGVLSLVILFLTQKNEGRTELENQEKEAQLRTTIGALENQLLGEIRTVRNLTVIANIHFSGVWDPADLPFSDQYFIAAPEHMVFVQGLGNLTNRLEFYGTKMYRFAETPGGHRVFTVAGAIRPGSWPLGQTIDSLGEIKSAVITMPMLAPAKLKSPKIRIHSALVQFTVNDKHVKKFVWEENANQNKDHVFPPPNPNFDNRLVYVHLADDGGLKNWEVSP